MPSWFLNEQDLPFARTDLTIFPKEPYYEPEAVVPEDDHWSTTGDLNWHDRTPAPLRVRVRSYPPMSADRLDALHRAAPDETSLPDFLKTISGEFLGVSRKQGEMATTSEYGNPPVRVGLHVDNYDRRPLKSRASSRSRLLINLGPGDRYALFCKPDIFRIAEQLGLSLTDIPGTADLRKYVRAGLPTECFRFRLRPGEGYIAATECLGHDGSTGGVSMHSYTAHWLINAPDGPSISAHLESHHHLG